MNPWTEIPISDYEKHMSDPGVYQLQTLSSIFKSKLIRYRPPSLAILGICSGNGLEHIDRHITHDLYGIDINEAFLKTCEQRHLKTIPGLHLYQLDLQKDEINIPEVHLLICSLIFEYVEPRILIRKIGSKVKDKGIVSAIIQSNNGISSVSRTGVHSLNRLESVFREVSPDELTAEFTEADFTETEREEIPLPNGKSFFSIDFKKTKTEK